MNLVTQCSYLVVYKKLFECEGFCLSEIVLVSSEKVCVDVCLKLLNFVPWPQV